MADDAKLSFALLKDLKTASMLREGCVIFNAAFVALVLLWLVLGGVIALLVRVLRRPKA